MSRVESATVKDLKLGGEFDLAYNTLMTTLDRLYKKDLLDRVREGKAFRYFARYTEAELHWQAATQAIEDLLASDSASLPLSYLVDALASHNADALEELQKLVESKRRELRERDE